MRKRRFRPSRRLFSVQIQLPVRRLPRTVIHREGYRPVPTEAHCVQAHQFVEAVLNPQ